MKLKVLLIVGLLLSIIPVNVKAQEVYEATDYPSEVGHRAVIEFINDHQFIVKEGKVIKSKIKFYNSDSKSVAPRKGCTATYGDDGLLIKEFDEDGLEVGYYLIASDRNEKFPLTKFTLKGNEIISSKKVYQYVEKPLYKLDAPVKEETYPIYSETLGIDNGLYGDSIIRKKGNKTLIYIKGDATEDGEIYAEVSLS